MKDAVTIAHIERATEKFSSSHDALCEEVEKLTRKIDALDAEIASAREKHMSAIRAAVKIKQQRELELATLIENAPELFKDPRTVEFHRVEVGMHFSKGSLEIPDKQKTVALIEEHFPALAKVLIKTEKSPVKNTIKTLPAEDHEKILVRFVGVGDHVVIKPAAGSEIEETVSRLLESPKK